MATTMQTRVAALVLAAAGVSAAGCSVEVKTQPTRDTSRDTKITGPGGGSVEIKPGNKD